MARKLKATKKVRGLKKVTMKPTKRGQKKVSFREGGLHATTGTPMGENVPEWKIQRALTGGYGPLGKKQAKMAKGMLAKGRRTTARNKRRGK